MERLTVFDGEFWLHKDFPPIAEDTIDEFVDCVKELAARLAYIEDILGDDYDLDRLRELVEADRDGRCYTTNVKIGDRIYFPDNKGGVAMCRVNGISLPAHGSALIIHRVGYPGEYLWTDREGIDWWKTRKAAKAVLKGDCNEN